MADCLAATGVYAAPFCPTRGSSLNQKQHDDHLLGQGDDPEVQWDGRSRKCNFDAPDIEQHGDATDGAAEQGVASWKAPMRLQAAKIASS
jgi:hypothetical protein